MHNIISLVKKELQYYMNSAVAYVLGVFFLVSTALIFFSAQHFVARDEASLRSYFQFFPFLMMIVIPALTMRSWAEEQKQGTQEILMTLPFSEWELVLGKFLAPFVLFCGLLVFTIFVPLSVLPLGDFDIGVIITEYFGILLLASASIAIGLWVSSLTKNQVTAFLVSVAVLLALTLLNQVATLSAVPAWFAGLINYLSLTYHVDSFIKGLIDSRDLLYFIALTMVFLFLNERSLVLRKWS